MMNDRTLPWWIRVEMGLSALGWLVFGVTMLVSPTTASALWPWPLSTTAARLLGASTMVSVPMAALLVYFNRYSVARIPLTIQVIYRVTTLVVGLMHFDRFDLTTLPALSYFAGGFIRMVIEAIALFWGRNLGAPADSGQAWLRGDSRLVLSNAAKVVLVIVGMLFAGGIGALFFVLGENAGGLWLEAEGSLTGLTARLFAAPALAMGIGIWLVTLSRQWREVSLPAVGMVTFGITGTLMALLEMAAIQPPTPVGYLVPITPLILLMVGVFLLLPMRSAQTA